MIGSEIPVKTFVSFDPAEFCSDSAGSADLLGPNYSFRVLLYQKLDKRALWIVFQFLE